MPPVEKSVAIVVESPAVKAVRKQFDQKLPYVSESFRSLEERTVAGDDAKEVIARTKDTARRLREYCSRKSTPTSSEFGVGIQIAVKLLPIDTSISKKLNYVAELAEAAAVYSENLLKTERPKAALLLPLVIRDLTKQTVSDLEKFAREVSPDKASDTKIILGILKDTLLAGSIFIDPLQIPAEYAEHLENDGKSSDFRPSAFGYASLVPALAKAGRFVRGSAEVFGFASRGIRVAEGINESIHIGVEADKALNWADRGAILREMTEGLPDRVRWDYNDVRQWYNRRRSPGASDKVLDLPERFGKVTEQRVLEAADRSDLILNRFGMNWRYFMNQQNHIPSALDVYIGLLTPGRGVGSAVKLTPEAMQGVKQGANLATEYAIKHPEFVETIKKLEQNGWTVVADRSAEVLGYGGYVDPQRKVIAIAPDAKWHVFKHELRHTLFSDVLGNSGEVSEIMRKAESVAKSVDGPGLKFFNAEGKELARDALKIQRPGMTVFSLNEALAVRGQLDELIASGGALHGLEIGHSKAYSISHHAEGLLQKGSKAIDDIVERMSSAKSRATSSEAERKFVLDFLSAEKTAAHDPKVFQSLRKKLTSGAENLSGEEKQLLRNISYKQDVRPLLSKADQEILSKLQDELTDLHRFIQNYKNTQRALGFALTGAGVGIGIAALQLPKAFGPTEKPKQ